MRRELHFTPEALRNLADLAKRSGKSGTLKQVRKTLALLETNIRHPSLNTHSYHSLHGPSGEEVFGAYAQNDTPGAFRVFFMYGPDRMEQKKRIPVLTIIAITPHP